MDHMLPNTPVSAPWRLTRRRVDAGHRARASLVYADDRFDWKTAAGDLVRVHWSEGGDAFGAAGPRRSPRTASRRRRRCSG